MHRRLEVLFSALEEAGVEWTLLRLPRDLELPPGDVDLLVRPRDLAPFSAAAREAGFVGLPGWEEWPSLSFFAFDPPTGRFLVLDVTDRVAFGRHGELPADVAAGVLRRRERAGDLVQPSADDAFWLLLLHCLLDKGSVPPHYVDRLRRGAGDADLAGELAGVVDAALTGSGLSAASLRALAADEDWAGLAAAAERVRQAWRRSVPVGRRLAAGMRWIRRLLGRPALLFRRRGLSVALLGPNGAGKSTLAAGIAGSFPLPVAQVYMGLWKVKDGRERSASGQLVDAAVRPFRAWARALQAVAHQAAGRLVVFDRYVYDARRPPASPAGTVKRAYFWLLSRTCPRPDLTLLLDLPGAVAHARKAENSLAEAEAERREFLALRQELPLHVLDASRPSDEVRSAALACIWDAYRERWGNGASRVPVPAHGRDGSG